MKNITDRTYKRLTEEAPAGKVMSVWMYVPVAVSLIVGLTLSLAAFAAVWKDESNEMHTSFSQAASERALTIEREMKQNRDFLDYIKAFYYGSEQVERDEFKEFVGYGMKNLNSFQVLGWAPRVLAEQRQQFEAAGPDPNFVIYYSPASGQWLPAPQSEVYYPILYLELLGRRGGGLGYDLNLYSDLLPILLSYACDNDQVIANNWTRRGRNENIYYSFSFFQPIYNKTETPLETAQQRRENLKGFVFGLYRVQDIIDTALEGLAEQDIDITISSYSEYNGLLTEYDYRTKTFRQTEVPANITREEAIKNILEESSNPTPPESSLGFLTYEHSLDFSGRKWNVKCQASEGYIRLHRTWHPWGVLVLGLMITALVTAYCVASIGYTARIENTVWQRTAELKTANEDLEAEIFERKRAEEAVEKLNRELAEKNRELESIIYATSHDLRSPLLNIKGFSKELTGACETVRSVLSQSRPDTPPQKKVGALLEKDIPQAVQYIQAGVDKLDKLLAGILQLSRLGQTVLTVELLDMNKMMGQIIKSTEYQIKEANATIEVGNLPACLGDENQINQVFSNLLDNALKYLDSSRPGIINITGHIDLDGRAVFCVKDNGIGIAPDQKEMIFELFHRLDPTNSFGEGLGLTIARRIINRHNGNIWVVSKPAQGSEFWVSMPTKGN